MRGAVKDAYQIRERGFDTPANRQRIGIVGGLGAVYPHPSQERKHRASVPPFPHKRATARHAMLRPRYPHLTTNAAATALRWPCDAMRNGNGPTRPARAPPTWPPGSPPKKRYSPQRLAIANKLYINARASAARFTHNVTAAGQQPRQAPAAAIGWAAGVPCAWRAGVRAIGAAVGPAPSGRGPWGTVRGAALRRACVNRRPMDGQQRPRWPRAAGMFQPGIVKTKFFLPMLLNNIILYHARRCCRA